MDWGVNSAIGVAFSYCTARTKIGRQYFGEPVAKLGKALLSPFLKSEAALNEGSKWFSMFASIMFGGTAIIPIMKKMEEPDFKEWCQRSIDKTCYTKEELQDPRFEEQYKAIHNEPKKDFKTGMIARFMAIAPLITLASIPATNKPMIKYIYDPIATGTKWLAKKCGIQPKKMMEEGAMVLLDGDPRSVPQFQSNWDYLHQTIGFDFGLTLFYSKLHEMSFKALAERNQANEKKQQKDNPSPHCEVSAVQPHAPALALQ